MWKGEVVSIQIGAQAGGPLGAVGEIRAETNGIVGDRKQNSNRAVTLIGAEALEAAGLTGEQSRRNITVRGVPLNELVGRRLRVGDAVLEGAEPCDPCMHMENLSGKPGAMKSLVGRGGLCARVIVDGAVRVGDVVEPA